ncbi:Peroxiredoxin AhpC-type [Penicillium cf. griseofulvum]|nr:Peroxiredoxin AhpC-type [Penicillium cf. griseofulvum]KAJ5436279.1 Peroxiredoxin AhpC-type [Penicillium cf. griseofulvum]
MAKGCTTELGAFAKLEPEFTQRGVRLIGLVIFVPRVPTHLVPTKSGSRTTKSTQVKFPITADANRKIAFFTCSMLRTYRKDVQKSSRGEGRLVFINGSGRCIDEANTLAFAPLEELLGIGKVGIEHFHPVRFGDERDCTIVEDDAGAMMNGFGCYQLLSVD